MSSDSGHWYTRDGLPMHTIMKKDGSGERNTTLADAKKLRLYPSVTSYLKVISSAQLEEWKQRQVAKWAFVNTPQPKETDDSYISRALIGSREETDYAAALGVQIHADLERVWEGQEPETLASKDYITGVSAWMQENVTIADAEKTVISGRYGLAGRIDIAGSFKGRNGILDFKSRKTKPGAKIVPYETQPMQIAAYGIAYYGIIPDYGANVYISSTEPGRFEVVEYGYDELASAWEAFQAACTIWRYMKGYDPR